VKLRLGALAIAAVLALPTLMPAGSWLAAPAAHAQDPVTDIARQRYKEGVSAFDAGKFEDARVAFLQAYALKRHPAVLLNLGLSELKSNHATEGGNHLTQFLRESTDATPEQRATAQAGIEDAKRRSAYLMISVDAPNADVSVDGTLIGKSPLADPYFVEPGTRTVVATLGTKNATFAAQPKRGVPTNVSLSVNGGTPPPLAPVPGPSPGELPPPDGPLVPQNPPPPPPPAKSDEEHESFVHWYGRKPLAWVGTGLTVAGLGVGIAFSVLAGSASSSAEDAESAIRDQQAEEGVDGAPCGPRDSTGSQDVDGFQGPCSALRQSLDDYDADVAIAGVGWVAFGVGLAGTVTYIMVDYVGGGRKMPKDGKIEPPILVPVISPEYGGAAFRTTF
jgi:hypothetical protein